MDDEKKKSKNDKVDADETSSSSDLCAPLSESGGPKGPEPTRFGDWEIKGKCVDF